MDFESYFQATEAAFAEEKEEMLLKIEKLHDKWTESAKLDQIIIDKSKKLSDLKKMIGKGHLQILRTKEECLYMQLKNSQLAFHVRQLESEINRLIPFSHTQVPSTEYHMSLDRTVFKATAHQNQTEADKEHMDDIKKIHKLWMEISDTQQRVFAEERLHYEEDNEQWNKFASSVIKQNQIQHNNIDKVLADLVQKQLSLKASNEEMSKAGEARANNLLKKVNKLKSRIDVTMSKMNKKKEEDKILAQKEANKLTKELRRRVSFIEGNNQNATGQMQEEMMALQDKEDDLLDDIDDIKLKMKKLEQRNKSLSDEGEKKLIDLQAQLSALVSAAADIKDTTDEEHRNIVSAVSSAIGKHGKTANKAEKIHLMLENLNRKLENDAFN